jgi:hypothetical protein
VFRGHRARVGSDPPGNRPVQAARLLDHHRVDLLRQHSAPRRQGAQAQRTRLTPDGLSTWSLLGRHSCRWEDIADIATTTTASRGAAATWIVVRLTSGQSFRLGAPYDLSTFRDPTFDERLGVINDCLAAHTKHDAT